MTRGIIRYGLGVLVSAAAIVAIGAQVDAREVVTALRGAAIGGIVVAVGLVVVEVVLRAMRWQLLLRPIHAVPLRTAFGYLCIGYFANAILPARLGDVTRAYLAGTAFGIRRTTTLGTILVERVSDGLLMLATVLAIGWTLRESASLFGYAALILLAGAAMTAILLLSLAGLRRSRVSGTSWWSLTERVLARLWAGTAALRRARSAIGILLLTVVAFAMAVVILMTVAGSLGAALSPAEGVLATAGLALSLSIPAAPGALGTYELVGMTILAGMGVPREQSLAIVVIHHAVVLIPPTLIGIVATWVFQVRVSDAASAADEIDQPGESSIPPESVR